MQLFDLTVNFRKQALILSSGTTWKGFWSDVQQSVWRNCPTKGTSQDIFSYNMYGIESRGLNICRSIQKMSMDRSQVAQRFAVAR
jgi:hypothetical protein